MDSISKGWSFPHAKDTKNAVLNIVLFHRVVNNVVYLSLSSTWSSHCAIYELNACQQSRSLGADRDLAEHANPRIKWPSLVHIAHRNVQRWQSLVWCDFQILLSIQNQLQFTNLFAQSPFKWGGEPCYWQHICGKKAEIFFNLPHPSHPALLWLADQCLFWLAVGSCR